MSQTTQITGMDQDELYQVVGSLGIASEALRWGVTAVERLGSGEALPGDLNSRCTFWRLTGGEAGAGGVRVAGTSGNPTWEEEDPYVFAELAEECGVALA